MDAASRLAPDFEYLWGKFGKKSADGNLRVRNDEKVCGECVDVCLGRALKRYGRDISVAEAREIVLEDRDFYRDGGGVTVSGGEPLLQANFCAALFRSVKEDRIGCAVDTSGAVSWGSFETVIPYTDIFLYDVKHIDDALHRIWRLECETSREPREAIHAGCPDRSPNPADSRLQRG